MEQPQPQAGQRAAKRQVPAVCLSERSMAELVSKLQQLGYVAGLLHSTDGNEYITAEQLRKEVQQAVKDAGGRINLVELPVLLSVDLVHCERAASEAVAAAAGQLQLLQGELVAASFFDTLAHEINELLQEAGVLSAGDLAQRFKLGTDLLLNTVRARLGSTILGQLEGQLLYTPAHVARIKAKLRGALRGALSPVAVPALLKELDLEGFSALIGPIVGELQQSGEVQGQLQGGARTWTPAVFARLQADSVRSFYQQNGHVGYSTVTGLGIANARAHLRDIFPDGIALDTLFVSPSVLQQLNAAVEDAAASGSWCDAMELLPSALTEADAAALLERCQALRLTGKGKDAAGAATVMAGTCAVSHALVARLQQEALQLARELAQQAVQLQQMPAGKGSGKGSSKAEAQHKAAADDSGDDDWGPSKGKAGQKGKAAKRRAGGKGKARPAGSEAPSKSGSNALWLASAEPPQQLSEAGLVAAIRSWDADLQDAGHGDSLVQELAEAIRPPAVAEFEQAVAAVFKAGSETRRRRREALARSLELSFQQLELQAGGCELFASDAATGPVLQRHLVRSRGAECVDCILRLQELDLQEDAGQAAAQQPEAAAPTAPLTSQARSAILRSLPPDVRADVAAAVDSLGGADMTATKAAIQAAAAAAGLRLRAPDKKQERMLRQQHQDALLRELAQEQEPAAVLSLAVPALVGEVLHRSISVPGRALAPVIAQLQGHLPEQQFARLQQLHEAVVEHLTSGKKAQEDQQRLHDLMTDIKDSCLQQQ